MHSYINYKILIAGCCLFLAQITGGVNIVGSKYLVTSLPVIFLLAIRFSIATSLLIPLHWATDHKKINLLSYFKQLTTRDWTFLILQALSAGILFNFLMISGLKYTSASMAGMITSALPAIIVIMSWVALKERFTLKKIVCVSFATIGLLVISSDNVDTSNFQTSLLGNFIVFLSLLPEASYYVLTKLHKNRLPVFLTSGLINGINALILLPIMFYYLDWNLIHLSFFDGFILFLVGLSSALFYVFWFLGSIHVDAVMSALSTALMPIATVVIAWLTLNEMISLTQCVGMGFVMLSIVAYAMPQKLKTY